MAITNGYCTLVEFNADKRITSTDATDDTVIEGIIEDASRLIDRTCGRTFYARTETRLYDKPEDKVLWLDDDLLTVTTLTNGDGTVIASTAYVLLPYNAPGKYAIELRPGQGAVWQMNTTYGDNLQAISVLGTWGFVSRIATDGESSERIRNTRSACIDIAIWEYLRRFGNETEVVTQITAAGVVSMPTGEMPKAAWKKIKDYIKL